MLLYSCMSLFCARQSLPLYLVKLVFFVVSCCCCCSKAALKNKTVKFQFGVNVREIYQDETATIGFSANAQTRAVPSHGKCVTTEEDARDSIQCLILLDRIHPYGLPQQILAQLARTTSNASCYLCCCCCCWQVKSHVVVYTRCTQSSTRLCSSPGFSAPSRSPSSYACTWPTCGASRTSLRSPTSMST